MDKQQQQRQTAKIIEFPARRRTDADRRRQGVQPNEQQAAAQLPTVDFGDAWYHQEAFEDEVSNVKYHKH